MGEEPRDSPCSFRVSRAGQCQTASPGPRPKLLASPCPVLLTGVAHGVSGAVTLGKLSEGWLVDVVCRPVAMTWCWLWSQLQGRDLPLSTSRPCHFSKKLCFLIPGLPHREKEMQPCSLSSPQAHLPTCSLCRHGLMPTHFPLLNSDQSQRLVASYLHLALGCCPSRKEWFPAHILRFGSCEIWRDSDALQA